MIASALLTPTLFASNRIQDVVAQFTWEYRMTLRNATKMVILAGSAVMLNLVGCADLAAVNAQLAKGTKYQSGAVSMATPTDGKPAQVVASKDKRVAAAAEDAMPLINQILTIHRCVQNWESQRLMNVYAVPGTDMAQMGGLTPELRYPNNYIAMKFHDRSKCVNVTTLDQWSMPALNALQFRAVYYADDSGETTSYLYLVKKSDDGTWKLAQFNR